MPTVYEQMLMGHKPEPEQEAPDYAGPGGMGGGLGFDDWLSSIPSLQQESFTPQAAQPMSPWERMGMNFTQLEPFRQQPFEGGGSAFLRALLTGAARSYGGAVQSRVGERERTRQEANEAGREAARQRNAARLAQYQMAPAYAKAMQKPEPKAADPMDELVDTPPRMRQLTGMDKATRGQIATFMKPSASGGGGSAAGKKLTPLQQQQLDMYKQRYDSRIGIVESRMGRRASQMASLSFNPEGKFGKRLVDEQAKDEVELERLSTEWERKRSDLLGLTVEQPSQGGGDGNPPAAVNLPQQAVAATVSWARGQGMTADDLIGSLNDAKLKESGLSRKDIERSAREVLPSRSRVEALKREYARKLRPSSGSMSRAIDRQNQNRLREIERQFNEWGMSISPQAPQVGGIEVRG